MVEVERSGSFGRRALVIIGYVRLRESIWVLVLERTPKVSSDVDSLLCLPECKSVFDEGNSKSSEPSDVQNKGMSKSVLTEPGSIGLPGEPRTEPFASMSKNGSCAER